MKKEFHYICSTKWWLSDGLKNERRNFTSRGKLAVFYTFILGRKQCQTGIISARIPEDRVITAYRDHGLPLTAVYLPKRYGGTFRQSNRLFQRAGWVDAHGGCK